MKRMTLISVAALVILVVLSTVTAMAAPLYSEDWESYAASTSLVATPAPAWDGMGTWWDGATWRTLGLMRLDIIPDLHPGWGMGLDGYTAGGYYSGYKVLQTRTWWKKTFGTQSGGVISASMNICPSGARRLSPAYPAGELSFIGLTYGYNQVATWQFVDPAAMPSDTATMKLVYAGGESPQFVIDAVNPETILTVTTDLNNMKVSGSITQGGNVWNTQVYDLTAGTTLDSIAFYQNKRSRYEFDIDDLTVTSSDLPGTITGTITLSDYTGDLELAPIKIQLIKDSVVTRTEWVTPTSTAQSYTITGVGPGTYDVAFSACKWLKKVYTGIQIFPEEIETINVPMVNGDLDGDNSVNSTDLSVLLTAM